MEEVKRGAAVERKEHPTMSPAVAARTARQHLQHHPMYYQLEPQFEKMLDRREKNMKPLPPKPRPAPQQQRDPFF